jgi:hypothetical protein
MLHFLPEQYDQDRLPVKTAHVVRDALIAEHTEARNNQSVSYRRTHYLIGYVNVVYTRGEIKWMQTCHAHNFFLVRTLP